MKILVLIDYSTEFSRRLLEGLIEYSQKVGNWSFYRLPLYYKSIYGEEGVIQWAKKWNADFIIVQWNYISIQSLSKLQIPVFLQDYEEDGKCFSNITGDYVGTGIMAAKFFIQRRYKNFAFYGKKGFIWSSEREKGFRQEIEKIQGKYYYFENEEQNELEWRNNHIQLEGWLISLPKPVAIFACDDSFAIQISEICKLNNINIPKEIALLGVDNDKLICNLSDPPISSIKLDAKKGGFELGEKIENTHKKQIFEPFNICVNPLEIELRQSTESYNIKDKNILKIVKYLQRNITLPIKLEELTSLVPLSRRGLEIKFKNEMGMPIYQFILDQRVELFTSLLVTTNLSISDITDQCGFNDYSNLYRLFRKAKGCSPIEYRKRFL
ncbi:MAG: DNA-binding transcriptional regulator [Candidatus Cloacimonetes bacterium]|nr:DNA-binding transcriptional regulator [Candidatus Cloacimonadota bacterium]MDD3868886.1 DNA-binding transcriptional regulator [Candidatus Cloacimonadota bacterium]